jgi:hypothetical protein
MDCKSLALKERRALQKERFFMNMNARGSPLATVRRRVREISIEALSNMSDVRIDKAVDSILKFKRYSRQYAISGDEIAPALEQIDEKALVLEVAHSLLPEDTEQKQALQAKIDELRGDSAGCSGRPPRLPGA